MKKSVAMKRSIALISIFAVLAIALSGCLGNNSQATNQTESNAPVANQTNTSVNQNNTGNPEPKAITDENASEISTLETVPAGFNYTGTIPLTVDEIKTSYKAGNASGIAGGSEGIYKANGTDFYVDVIELENQEDASNLIATYKASFPALNQGSRFTEETINGRNVTRIMDLVTSNGKAEPRYSYIWNNENFAIIVFGNTPDASIVKQLAVATEY
jgi:hypothetical protein